jgi:succinoglycan biosynthesis transport protein ExoP
MDRTYTFREMLAALGRRRWLAIATAFVVLAVGAALVVALPPEYRSESVMQMEPHRLPPEFMPAAATSFEERMRTLKHSVLARPILERVLRETDFYKDWKDDPDEALERLRKNVEVRLEGELAAGPPALLFVVEVRGPDREKVAKAADMIPRLWADLTRQVLTGQARNLRDTLQKQIGEMGKEMAAQEEKLVAFKTEHGVETPDANESNLRAAAAIHGQIDMRLMAIADAERRRTTVLVSVPEQFTGPGLAESGLEDAQRRLEAARASYGPDNPDVKRYERAVAEASARSADMMKRFRKDRLDAQVSRIDEEVRGHETAIRDLQKQYDRYLKRLDAAPRWGEAYRAMSREYDALKLKYASVLSRAADAQAAEQLLAADAPGLFRFVQAAATATKPAGPDRVKLGLVAVAVAIMLSLLAVGGAEYFDTTLRGAQDAGAFGVPVLAAIPRIGPRGRVAAQR